MKGLMIRLILAVDEAMMAAMICTRYLDGKKAPGILLLAAMILVTEWILGKNADCLAVHVNGHAHID